MVSQPLETAPPDVRAVAAEHGLGSLHSTYAATAGRAGVTAFKVAFSVALAALLGFWAVTEGGIFIVLAVFFGAAAVLTVARAVHAVRSGGGRVYLFESGFVHTGRAGAARAFRWDEIEVLRDVTRTYNAFGTTDHKFTVTRPDGAKVVLSTDTFWDVGELGQQVEQRVTETQTPTVLAAVGAGETVNFGPLSVDAHGLHDQRETATWDQVTSVGLRDGKVRLEDTTRRRTRTYDINRVPNVFVLAAVANALAAERR